MRAGFLDDALDALRRGKAGAKRAFGEGREDHREQRCRPFSREPEAQAGDLGDGDQYAEHGHRTEADPHSRPSFGGELQGA